MALALDRTDVAMTHRDTTPPPAATAPIAHPVDTEALSALTPLDPEKHYEFVNNRWEEKAMAGARHGGVVIRLSTELWLHVREHHLGGVYSANTTFMIGNNQRLPDIAFIRNERIPADGEPEGIWPIAPDLAIEVISPSDTHASVMEKVVDYLNAGVKEVWIVLPTLRTITLYHEIAHAHTLTESQELTSSVVLPDFHCSIAALFRSPTPSAT